MAVLAVGLATAGLLLSGSGSSVLGSQPHWNSPPTAPDKAEEQWLERLLHLTG